MPVELTTAAGSAGQPRPLVLKPGSVETDIDAATITSDVGKASARRVSGSLLYNKIKIHDDCELAFDEDGDGMLDEAEVLHLIEQKSQGDRTIAHMTKGLVIMGALVVAFFCITIISVVHSINVTSEHQAKVSGTNDLIAADGTAIASTAVAVEDAPLYVIPVLDDATLNRMSAISMSVTNVVHTATNTIIPNATYSFKVASYLKVNATYAALWSDTGDELRIVNAVATLRFGAGTGLSGSTLVCAAAASCARVNVNGLDIAALRATAAAALASIGVTVVDSRRTRRGTSVGASSAGVGPRGNLQSLEVPTGGFPRQDWSIWIQHQCSEAVVVGGQAYEHYSCSPSGILRKISLDALVERDAVQGIDIGADQWVRQAQTSPATTSIEFPVAGAMVGIHCTTIAPGFDDPAPPLLVGPSGISTSPSDLTAMQCSSSLTCHGDSYSGAPGRQCACAGGGTQVGVPGTSNSFFNGCGVPPMNIDLFLYPEEISCCHSHDICYGSAGATQLGCDTVMYNCFLAAGATVRRRRGWWYGAVAETHIRAKAYSFYQGLAVGGPPNFDKGQRDLYTCQC